MNGKPEWTLRLNQYQRDNLLWLLELVASRDFHEVCGNHCDTGDWYGEIKGMLEPAHAGDPNISHEDWIKAAKTIQGMR